MSEFKVSGGVYVSQWNGSSLNSGTPTSPFSHPIDVVDNTLLTVLGTGVYKGSMGVSSRRLIGDGFVVVDLLGTSFTANQTLIPNLQNIYFKNGGVTGTSRASLDCVFENFNNLATIPTRCVFINCTGTPVGAISNSIVFQIGSGNVTGLNYSFVDKPQNIIYTGTVANFNNNLFNGRITISGVSYELKRLFDGSTRPDADPLIPDLNTASGWSGVYTNGNFAGDPKFVDASKRIVSPDSDLLKRSNSNGFIGGAISANYFPVNTTDPNVEISTSQIDTSNPTNWIIESGQTFGFITITYRTDTISEVQAIFIDALLAFDGSLSGGSVGNNNVPDNFPTNYSPLSQPGLKPNRLLFELRTSQSISKPTSDIQWDNDNVALGTTPGEFYLMEWGQKPTIHSSSGNLYGNGNPASIGISGNAINARWRQVKIRLTNNRSF